MAGGNDEKEVRLGRLEHFVGFQLRRIQNQLSRDFAGRTSGYNLKSGLFSMLAIISANPGISQTEVSRVVGLDKSVTVQIVDDLEARGLAERKRSTSDRRQHALFITEQGESFLAELFDIMRETESEVLAQIRPDELVLLHKVLNRMYAIYEHPAPKRRKVKKLDS